MPALQQSGSIGDYSPNVGITVPAADILQRHSINSLLDHQEILNRGHSSPTEGETMMSISDLLGLSNPRSSVFSPTSANNLQNYSSQTQQRQNSYRQPTKTLQQQLDEQFYGVAASTSTPNNKSMGTTPINMFQSGFENSLNSPTSPPGFPRAIRGNGTAFSDCSGSPTTPIGLESLAFGCSTGTTRSNSPADSDNNVPNQQILDQNAHLKEMLLNCCLNNQQMGNYAQLSNADQFTPNYQALRVGPQMQNKMLGSIQFPLLPNPVTVEPQWRINGNIPVIDMTALDRAARYHRNAASLYEATCTWSGILPSRSAKIIGYSPKVFLGGVPWDITEQMLMSTFKHIGPIKVEWPGKEQQATQPKGYVYIIFESEKQVKHLLSICNSDVSQGVDCTNYYYRISSKRMKSKEVQVIPWILNDSNHVKSTSQKLDPCKTVFVGALHGMLNAEGLGKVMNDLFEGVVYAGIDTDKYKYPIGSGRVTFNNPRSYMKAVTAAFIEIKTAKFSKKVQVDPYLEDSLCSLCGVQQGPYFCRDVVCFRYFCRTCWQLQHNSDNSLRTHKPLMRTSKTIIGVGPGATSEN